MSPSNEIRVAPDETNPVTGLSETAARARLERDGPNTVPMPAPPGLLAQIGRVAAQPLTLLLLGAALATGIALDEVAEGVAIGCVVVMNVGIEVALQRQASDALAELAALTSPTATVRRDGEVRVRDAAALVRGDLIELTAGDRVPADAELVGGSALLVDESILTGESAPVHRSPKDDPADRVVRGGTMVYRGSATAVVVATGSATVLGTIASSIGTDTTPPLVSELRTIAARVSLGAVVIGTVLGLVVAQRGDADAADGLLAVVALSVAAIPEGLPTTVIAALALGARTMARRGTIVQNLASIDALGATSVLCTDKTGTITTGRLQLVGIHPLPGRDVDLWNAIARCHDAHDGVGDPIDVLVAGAAAERGYVGWPRVDARPFDGETRSMAVVGLSPNGEPTLAVKGAPEQVLARCQTGSERDQLCALAARLSIAGERVIAVADQVTSDLDAGDLRPVGLISFLEEIRPTAAATVAGFRDAGIRVVMATGDNAATAAAICRSVGLPTEAVYSGGGSLPDDTPALSEADLVARVDPLTKLALIDAHRADGHVVAMLGDGVNDAPALKRADVGVAVSGHGTDVARSAADVVLTDGDLGTLLVAVREGRRIYRNLKVATGYLIAGNLSEVLVFVGALVVFPDLAVPLLPLQILWLNLMTDGLPAVVLGIDDPPTDLLTRAPRRPGGSILTRTTLAVMSLRAVTIATLVLGVAWVVAHDGGEVAIRSQLLFTLGATHLALALIARSSRSTFERGWGRNRLVLATVAISFAAHSLLFVVPASRSLLDVSTIDGAGWVATAAAVATLVALADGSRQLVRPRRPG